MATKAKPSVAPDQRGTSPAVLAPRHDLSHASGKSLATFDLGGLSVELLTGLDALWAIIRRPGKGGLALRAAHAPGGCLDARVTRPKGMTARVALKTVLGDQAVEFRVSAIGLPVLSVTTTLTPTVPLLVPFLPRDLYPLDRTDDPLGATGQVEAAQRGVNSGLVYFHLDEPDFGTVLYFQNLTALNDYYRATGTKPDAAVGGEWPELGYLPPTRPQSGTPPTDPLPAGVPVILSDARLVFHEPAACDEQDTALRFVQMLGAAYRHIDLPSTDYRDWVWRAEKTLDDLDSAPEATIRHYGHRYVHPYTDAEYPDVMVQMSVVASLHDYGVWKKEPVPLEAAFSAGLVKFHDTKLGTMRRYLPNVGKDKDKLAVDSWYLYHPLLNLGKLALDGDRRATRFFLSSLDYAIKAARHFDYARPIQFKVDSFDVIVEARNDDGLGQTDVGGLYAYVMLQAYELTGEPRFLTEARVAIDAAKNMRFDLTTRRTSPPGERPPACVCGGPPMRNIIFVSPMCISPASSTIARSGIGDCARPALQELPWRDLSPRRALYGDL